MTRPVRKLLVANRGEIAIRIFRTCREMGIRTVAVFSDPDRHALHTRMADEALCLGGTTASESYLQQQRIIQAAVQCGADAIHPGYGFLSENPDFAAAVEAAGLAFVGPSAESIRVLGDKTAAKKMANELGIPTVPGTINPLSDLMEAARIAASVGYPILLKAAAGGGGKGMRVVSREDDLESLLSAARSEALKAFGDDRVFMEKYIQSPRHVEIQIIADRHNNICWLGERDCSIQRRHQKVIEESPSPAVDEVMRRAMGEAAVRLASAAGYVNAGTVEFIVDAAGKYYFLEMNTRLQVEHPVTELVTGLDLVRLQVEITEGIPLPFSQEQIVRSGHSIECRVYAEDPLNDFLPSTGRIKYFRVPQGPRVRTDSGVEQNDTVRLYYDSMLAKVIAWGRTREEAILAMDRALSEFVVAGISTTIPFCRFVLRHKEFRQGRFDTHFVENHFSAEELYADSEQSVRMAVIAGALLWDHTKAESSRRPVPTTSGPESKWRNQRTSSRRS